MKWAILCRVAERKRIKEPSEGDQQSSPRRCCVGPGCQFPRSYARVLHSDESPGEAKLVLAISTPDCRETLEMRVIALCITVSAMRTQRPVEMYSQFTMSCRIRRVDRRRVYISAWSHRRRE